MTLSFTLKIFRCLQQNIFPLIHAIIYGLLFCWLSSFFYRDNNGVLRWSAIGFCSGLVIGIAMQWQLNNFLSMRNSKIKYSSLAVITLVELALTVLLFGPLLWALLNFTPRDNRHSICCETPLDYGATEYQNLRLNSIDDGVIAGWYVAPRAQVGKVVILIHGSGYDRRGTDFYTRLLLREGYGVLLYDLRNHGESSGKVNSFNRMAIYQADLLQVVNYVKQKPEIDPKKIGVVEISLGAFATLNSSTDTLNSFAALWLDGLRFENFSAPAQPQTLAEFGRWLFDRQARALAGIYYQQEIAPRNLPFAQIIPRIERPQLMLVASGLDQNERQTNERFIPLMGGNKEIWFIANAWHIGGRFEIPQEYGDRMLNFFARAMAD